MVINMLQNLSHMYFSHNNNVKCIGSTIKHVDFKPIYYTINLDVISFIIILIIYFYLIVLINKIIFLLKREKTIPEFLLYI